MRPVALLRVCDRSRFFGRRPFESGRSNICVKCRMVLMCCVGASLPSAAYSMPRASENLPWTFYCIAYGFLALRSLWYCLQWCLGFVQGRFGVEDFRSLRLKTVAIQIRRKHFQIAKFAKFKNTSFLGEIERPGFTPKSQESPTS